jgi:hypothetical protein
LLLAFVILALIIVMALRGCPRRSHFQTRAHKFSLRIRMTAFGQRFVLIRLH